MKQYEPEIGQYLFGQPYQEYGCPAWLESFLLMIRDELDRVMWNKNQEEYASPFSNTGNSFKNDVFEVVAYSWDDDAEQLYNFKCGDIEVSWYKHLGRGMSVNRKITPKQGADMLDKCLNSLSDIDNATLDELIEEDK